MRSCVKRGLFAYVGMRVTGFADYTQLDHMFVDTEDAEVVHMNSLRINVKPPTIGNMCYLERTPIGYRYDGEEGTQGDSDGQVKEWEMKSRLAEQEYYAGFGGGKVE